MRKRRSEGVDAVSRVGQVSLDATSSGFVDADAVAKFFGGNWERSTNEEAGFVSAIAFAFAFVVINLILLRKVSDFI